MDITVAAVEIKNTSFKLLIGYLYDNKIFSYGEAPEPPRPVIKRYETEKLPVDERIKNFHEVEQAYDEHTAALEARRCLRCMRVGMFATGEK